MSAAVALAVAAGCTSSNGSDDSDEGPDREAIVRECLDESDWGVSRCECYAAAYIRALGAGLTGERAENDATDSCF